MPTNTVASLAALFPSEVVSAEWLRLRTDRNISILAHPALHYAGDAMGKGSLTFKVPHLGLDGYKLLEQVADGAAVAESELDDDESSLTVAPWRKAYAFTDLVAAVQSGQISSSILARDAVMSAGNTLVNIIAQLVGGGSNTSGTPGAALTGLHILSAKNALSARSVPGPYLCLLSGSQIEDFQGWLATTSGGGIQWMEATRQQIEAWGDGYQGNWGGVDIFLSNRVPTVNAGIDSAGGMLGFGGISWGDSSFAPELDPNIVDFGGAAPGDRAKVRFERSRTGLAGKTSWITHSNVGAAEGQDAAIQSIITLAT